MGVAPGRLSTFLEMAPHPGLRTTQTEVSRLLEQAIFRNINITNTYIYEIAVKGRLWI